MKVRMRVSTNKQGSEVIEILEYEDDDFEYDDFENWVQANINSSYEIIEE